MLKSIYEDLIKLTQIETIQIQNLTISTKSLTTSSSTTTTTTTITTSSSSSSDSSTSSSEFNSEPYSNNSKLDFLSPNSKIVTSPSTSSSSISHSNSNKPSTYALTDRNQSLIQKNRNKFIKSLLLDSYLTISIPTYEDKPFLISEIQFSTNNPTFSIDLNHLQHLQPSIQPFINHHSFIDRNRILILTLFTRPTYPTTSSKKIHQPKSIHLPDSSLSESDHRLISSNHQFKPTLTWEINLDYPNTLRKVNDQDRILNQKQNQLYLKTQDKVYVYRISDQSDATHHTKADELDGYASDDEANPKESYIDQCSAEDPSTSEDNHQRNPLQINTSVLSTINQFDQHSDGKKPSCSDYNRNFIKSLAVNDLIKLVDRHLELDEVKLETLELECKIDQWFSSTDLRERCSFNLSRKLEQMKHRIDVLDQEEMRNQIQLKLLKTSILDQRETIRKRKERNQVARKKLSDLISINLTKMKERLETELIPTHSIILKSITQTRSKLIQNLSIIYPIELSCEPLRFSILNIRLEPIKNKSSSLIQSSNFLKFFNSEQEEEEQNLSSALGFVVGLVKLLSFYLSIPLLYPLTWMGSRCLITDRISLIRGTRTFPLYYKGVDRYRFEYGMFLLNKDIEQMMYHRQLTVIDIKDTLANLKNFMLTLEILGREEDQEEEVIEEDERGSGDTTR